MKLNETTMNDTETSARCVTSTDHVPDPKVVK